MLDVPFKFGMLIVLFAVGALISQPGFDQPGNANVADNIGDAIGNHGGLLLIPIAIWLLWKPFAWALRLFFTGLFLGEGVKHSGVLRRDEAYKNSSGSRHQSDRDNLPH